MQIKSIITKIHEINKNEDDMHYIRAETVEGNEIVFWGRLDSCVNLLALERQVLPVLIGCQQCKKETTCTHLLGDYFSVEAEAVVTIYPHDPKIIGKLLIEGARNTNMLIESLHDIRAC